MGPTSLGPAVFPASPLHFGAREVGADVGSRVVFISHFAVKEGALDELKRMSGTRCRGHPVGKPSNGPVPLPTLERGRCGRYFAPGTLFPDRATRWTSTSRVPTFGLPAAYEFIEPRGWEALDGGSRASGAMQRDAGAERRRSSACRWIVLQLGVQRRIPSSSASQCTDEVIRLRLRLRLRLPPRDPGDLGVDVSLGVAFPRGHAPDDARRRSAPRRLVGRARPRTSSA